ncbi:MAG: HAD hydrolase-like protein [Treponema sp.]|jgi:phosphoglycolate phosphatase/putative hydrolase of the HAD superfamily|nr:HAD hydrolase-like protein [Treponema sp.]
MVESHGRQEPSGSCNQQGIPVKCYSLPQKISALIFDMDGTLYTNPYYAQLQIDCAVKKLARVQGKTFGEMQREIAGYRKRWADAHNGRKTSLAHVFLAFGISIEESVKWREELYSPADYLSPNPALRETLKRFKDLDLKLALVTNNPVLVARKTLAALDVEGIFGVCIGLDTCLASKPSEAPFRKAAELLGAEFRECVSVGDRFDVDIAVPLELGMGGILVDGVEDVYRITIPANVPVSISAHCNI